MNKGTAFGTVFGLALLAALVVGGFLLLEYVGGVFSSLEPTTRTLAAIGSVVALLSAVIVAEGLKARGVHDRQPRAQKVHLYERLLTVSCERWYRAERATAQEMAELAETERSLSLLGGSRVITAYLKLKRARHDEVPGAIRADLLKRVVAEMRRDIGSQDLITEENELLELLVEPDGTADAAPRTLHE